MTADAPPLRAFGEGDGDLRHLADRKIAFIGYGNQGRAQALNLRDSGVTGIRVATLKDGTWERAEADGFPLGPVDEAVQEADVLFLLIPDEDLPAVFPAEIAPHLKPNDVLVFASGYNLVYDGVTLPPDIDVMLLAPRMIGEKLRQLYERGEGFYSYVAVEQDASGQAWPLLLALAKGIGTLRLGAFELSAKDETYIDLFYEQGFGAIIGSAILLMLEVGKEAGLPLEALVLDGYLSGEMAETFEAMAEYGFFEQSKLHSRTSQYGGMTRTIAFDKDAMRQHLQKAIEGIKDGSFAREWAAERETGAENFERLRALGRKHNPFTPIEERLRASLREAQSRSSSE